MLLLSNWNLGTNFGRCYDYHFGWHCRSDLMHRLCMSWCVLLFYAVNGMFIKRTNCWCHFALGYYQPSRQLTFSANFTLILQWPNAYQSQAQQCWGNSSLITANTDQQPQQHRTQRKCRQLHTLAHAHGESCILTKTTPQSIGSRGLLRALTDFRYAKGRRRKI